MTIQDSAAKIYVVDDDAAVRDALVFLFDSVDLSASAFASARDFLDHYTGAAGVLVLDVRMPGMSGLELQQELVKRELSENLAIIFISGHGDIPMAVEALKRGAADFVPKPFRDQELLDRVHQALESSRATQQEAEQRREVRLRIESLTPREREVMALVAEGKANKVVAIELAISQRTVEIHRAHVMEKMAARSLAQLVRMLVAAEFF